MKMKRIRLETERLVLRTVREGDAPAIYAYRSRADVGKYQTRYRRLADARRLIKRVSGVALNTPDTWHQLAVIEKGGGLIGDLGIHFTGKENRQAEIAYTIAPGYQGKGYATEAVLGMMGFLFDKLRKHRLVATADPRNKGSIRLMERVGMRREAYFKKSFWTGKEWTDDVLYALLKEEWPVLKTKKSDADGLLTVY
jgi:RimJ/RimL family protein N-acetyltransferase